MKKILNRAGFSLIEMLAALLILVLLVVGMDAGMSMATRVYSDSIFESNAGSLAGILNTAIGDVLRYSEEIRINPGNFEDSDGNYIPESEVGFVFTNFDYGVRNAYFHTAVLNDGTSHGTLQIKNLQDSKTMELVNTGAYPGLEITNFRLTYIPPAAAGAVLEPEEKGGYFTVEYDIMDTEKEDRVRHVNTVVRLMNPQI